MKPVRGRLEKEEIQPRDAVRRGELGREDGDPRPAGSLGIERDRMLALGEERTGNAVGSCHGVGCSGGFGA